MLTIKLSNTKEGAHLGQIDQVDEGRCSHAVQPPFCASPPCGDSEAVSSSETWHQHPVLPALPEVLRALLFRDWGWETTSITSLQWSGAPAWLLSVAVLNLMLKSKMQLKGISLSPC